MAFSAPGIPGAGAEAACREQGGKERTWLLLGCGNGAENHTASLTSSLVSELQVPSCVGSCSRGPDGSCGMGQVSESKHTSTLLAFGKGCGAGDAS